MGWIRSAYIFQRDKPGFLYLFNQSLFSGGWNTDFPGFSNINSLLFEQWTITRHFPWVLVGEHSCSMVSHYKFSCCLVELFGTLRNGAELVSDTGQ